MRLTRIITLIAVGALALGACGGDSDSSTATTAPAPTDTTSETAAADTPAELTSLVISATGVDSLPFMAMLQVGIDKGWFEEEGVAVELFSGGGGGDTMRVVSTGDADMAIAGNSAVYLAAAEEDSNLTIVGSWFQVNDFLWLTNDPDAELTGAKLGFSRAGSTTELALLSVQAALPDENLELIQIGGQGENWAAVQGGQITAGWSMHPFASEKIMNEGAHVLFASRDVIGDHPADLVAVNSDYAAENPEALKAFFRGAERVMDYVVNDTEAAAADLAGIMQIDEEIVLAGLQDTPDLEKAYSLVVDPEALANLSDLMLNAGQIDAPVVWADVLDQQYLPEDARVDL